jgi:hypothetical protein
MKGMQCFCSTETSPVYGAAGERTLQVSFILKGGSFDIGPYLKF